ncbi:hypothetical protein MUK42_35116 [Musa troglodytarum]|uniref:Uncharacterized protein n=1 Tax=Musa troglodytarum TaxID=320322 RepID=A0A9E7H2W1_9LILI|nr:hypothetical protein MUK42_35116 [Musa troglodytarum]
MGDRIAVREANGERKSKGRKRGEGCRVEGTRLHPLPCFTTGGSARHVPLVVVKSWLKSGPKASSDRFDSVRSPCGFAPRQETGSQLNRQATLGQVEPISGTKPVPRLRRDGQAARLRHPKARPLSQAFAMDMDSSFPFILRTSIACCWDSHSKGFCTLSRRRQSNLRCKRDSFYRRTKGHRNGLLLVGSSSEKVCATKAAVMQLAMEDEHHLCLQGSSFLLGPLLNHHFVIDGERDVSLRKSMLGSRRNPVAHGFDGQANLVW